MTLFYEVGISDRLLLIVTRDLTKPQRQRQRESQKTIGLISKTTTLQVQKSTLFCKYLCLHCTTTTRNDQILSLLGDGKGKAINSTISDTLYELERVPLSPAQAKISFFYK